MNVCIGIISYFPDELSIREVRVERLKDLIDKCNINFGLPILIVAQNGNGEIEETPNLKVFHYDKLGITGARKKLREHFLDLGIADYIICLDDDFELNARPEMGQLYLKQIKLHPNGIFEYENYLMNLAAISRRVFLEIDYDDIEAEKGEGFEDWIFMSKAQKQFKSSYMRIKNMGLPAKKRSELVEDVNSTWWHGQFSKNDMTAKSRRIIDEQTSS